MDKFAVKTNHENPPHNYQIFEGNAPALRCGPLLQHAQEEVTQC
jgi:hypothetical protein